jgi:hypothetical protein
MHVCPCACGARHARPHPQPTAAAAAAHAAPRGRTGNASGRTLVILMRLQADAHAHCARMCGDATWCSTAARGVCGTPNRCVRQGVGGWVREARGDAAMMW